MQSASLKNDAQANDFPAPFPREGRRSFRSRSGNRIKSRSTCSSSILEGTPAKKRVSAGAPARRTASAAAATSRGIPPGRVSGAACAVGEAGRVRGRLDGGDGSRGRGAADCCASSRRDGNGERIAKSASDAGTPLERPAADMVLFLS
jgi:hypothetical protein